MKTLKPSNLIKPAGLGVSRRPSSPAGSLFGGAKMKLKKSEIEFINGVTRTFDGWADRLDPKREHKNEQANIFDGAIRVLSKLQYTY